MVSWAQRYDSLKRARMAVSALKALEGTVKANIFKMVLIGCSEYRLILTVCAKHF